MQGDYCSLFIYLNHASIFTFLQCPSTLLEEKQYNPFIRTAEESIVRALGLVSDDSFKEPSDQQRACILEEIRERKDQFKYKL